MDLAQIGLEIRRYRQALGLTQAQLAEKARITRTTINQLENGMTSDLGVRKVLAVLAALNLTLVPHPVERGQDYVRLATGPMNVRFKTEITQEEFTHALRTGRVPAKRRVHLHQLFEEAPAVLRIGLMAQLRKSIPAGKLERNIERIASAIGVPEATQKWLTPD